MSDAPGQILSVADIYAADAAAAASGIDSYDLMRRAGTAVAEAVMARCAPSPTAVLCGPGANGGDGYVAARALRDAGWPVRVLALSEAGHPDAIQARDAWGGPVEALSPDALGDARVAIDALFGAGLTRPLPEVAAETLRKAERDGLRLFAVDVPSGLDGDSARPLEYAPACEATVTFHRLKRAHVFGPGRTLCGEVIVADIGIPDEVTPASSLVLNGPELWADRLPWPTPDTHKHARGRLGVVGGKRFDTGAARLAARAGLRLAGTVRVFCGEEAAPTFAAHLEAAMLKTFETAADLEGHAREMQAFVVGPAAGLNEATRENLAALSRAGCALVVDADALTVFKDDPEALFALLDERDVMTPHTGEFERIFPGLLGDGDKVAAAREAAGRAGCVVVLKGSETVIAAPDGRTAVNTHATPWLATAGSGDTLAGAIGGLLAGRMDAFDAACAGVWMHGDAGLRAGPGLTAEDLSPALREVIAGLVERAAGTGRRHPQSSSS